MGDRPQLDAYIRDVIEPHSGDDTRVQVVTDFCGDVCARAPTSVDEMEFGGTEEEIIARGSAWCIDVARVACALFQVTGLPSRLVIAADTERPYSGHVLTGVWTAHRWCAVDPTYGIVFLQQDGMPTSMWELIQDAGAKRAFAVRCPLPYVPAEQFRTVALAAYDLAAWRNYDYSVSRVNAYYRRILDMAHNGWPGGLRWLDGEDR